MELEIIKKLQTLEKSYIAFGRFTRMPFVLCDNENYNDQIRLFESRDEAVEFCDKLQDDTKNVLMVAEITNIQMLNFYGSLFLIGIDEVVVKLAGQEEVVIPLDKIVVEPDLSKMPAVNQNLELTGLYFMQELARRVPNEDKKALPEYEEEMASNIVKSKFIVPVLVNEVSEENKKVDIKLPRITNKDKQEFQPLFTDVNEFAKFNKENKYRINVMDFDTVLRILDESVAGAVINPFGMNIVLSKETLSVVKTRFE